MTESFGTDLELFSVSGDDIQAVLAHDKEAVLNALYQGLPLGVYTAMRTFEHVKFLHLEEHLSRLDRSMAMLSWDYHLDRIALRLALHQVCNEYNHPDARVRIDILAKGESQFITGSRVLISLQPFTPIAEQIYQNGVQVSIVPALTRDQPEIKKAEFAVLRRKYLESDPTKYECLIANEDGFLLEGTTSNYYGVRDGVIWTAGSGVLEGVARMIVLKLADVNRIEVRYEPLTTNDIPTLSEAALSSSSRGLIPIVQIGEQIVGDGTPGPITKQLIGKYRDYVLREMKPAL